MSGVCVFEETYQPAPPDSGRELGEVFGICTSREGATSAKSQVLPLTASYYW